MCHVFVINVKQLEQFQSLARNSIYLFITFCNKSVILHKTWLLIICFHFHLFNDETCYGSRQPYPKKNVENSAFISHHKSTNPDKSQKSNKGWLTHNHFFPRGTQLNVQFFFVPCLNAIQRTNLQHLPNRGKNTTDKKLKLLYTFQKNHQKAERYYAVGSS